jgi:2'-5' RNA ligase
MKNKKPKVHRRRWGPPAGPARRVFVGIRIEGDALEQLGPRQRMLPPVPMRLIPEADIHLTLVPPWMERDIAGAGKRLRDALERPFVFELMFQRLAYGPTDDDPRLVWVTCEASKELLELRERLLVAFGKREREKVPFVPHVTIARLKGSFGDAWKAHPVDGTVRAMMRVEAVELLGSPHRGGIGYETLKRVRLHREDETPH